MIPSSLDVWLTLRSQLPQRRGAPPRSCCSWQGDREDCPMTHGPDEPFVVRPVGDELLVLDLKSNQTILLDADAAAAFQSPGMDHRALLRGGAVAGGMGAFGAIQTLVTPGPWPPAASRRTTRARRRRRSTSGAWFLSRSVVPERGAEAPLSAIGGNGAKITGTITPRVGATTLTLRLGAGGAVHPRRPMATPAATAPVGSARASTLAVAGSALPSLTQVAMCRWWPAARGCSDHPGRGGRRLLPRSHLGEQHRRTRCDHNAGRR